LAENTWSVLLSLAPWLLVGMGVAGFLHVVLPPRFLEQQLQGLGGVFKAVVLGVPLPLCSCGVIPAGLGLKRDGASDGATIGFLISTPQTGVDSILVCAAFLGWPFTLFKVAVAGITGVLGGSLSHWFGGPRVLLDSGSSAARSESRTWKDGVDHALFVLRSIWGWLVVGVLASAAIQTWLPPSFFAGSMAWGGLVATLGVLLISLPLYVCATASVPIAAALVAGGMPAGAAIVFLMAGPATNVATIGAILRGFGARILGIYLSTLVVCSVLAAQLFDYLLDTQANHHMGHGEHGGWIATASAVLLLGLIGRFAMEDVRGRMTRSAMDGGQPALEVAVGGMTCGGCVNRLTGLLEKMDGVDEVVVDLEPGKARVKGRAERSAIEEVIRNAGFEVGEP